MDLWHKSKSVYCIKKCIICEQEIKFYFFDAPFNCEHLICTKYRHVDNNTNVSNSPEKNSNNRENHDLGDNLSNALGDSEEAANNASCTFKNIEPVLKS